MRRSRPRVRESKTLAGTVSILWSTIALILIAALAIGLWLYLPGTNAIEGAASSLLGGAVT